MEIIKGHKRVRGFTKEDNKQRYKLHKEARKDGFIVLTRSRIVLIPIEDSETDNSHVKELVKNFGYQLQTVCFSSLTQDETYED